MRPTERILVVDPERNVGKAMIRALEAGGFGADAVGSLGEALRQLGQAAYDLVLLELRLPDGDGLAALPVLRRDWPGVRVVVTTANGSLDRAVQAMKLGAADFVQKPISGAEITSLVRSVLSVVPAAGPGHGYEQQVGDARRALLGGRAEEAIARARIAVSLEPCRPEAFNLLGAATHLGGNRFKAQDYFRAALALDATYAPARHNLERSVGGGVQELHMELALGADNDGKG
jgi:DNA-binding response OmpR family regulator